ncbi:putative defense protein [Daphnia pulex]|uniref:putative defense protein n=1 Tax=Daphnia pulex TaxID=6669 RepID=UPI001EDF73C9|nr:putative defense protein [Daphnia pulex]
MMESKRSFPFVAGCLVLLVIGCCRISVDATPNGAPPEACATMTPQHGVDWQQKDCPFEIIVEKSTIYVGESLKIQLGIKSGLEANDPFSRGFKGFMIMAFDAAGQNTEPLGIFDGTTPNSEIQTMDCPTPSKGPNYKAPKSGVTHTNNGFKKSVEVLWTPPADLIGPIIISATFVHEKDVIWVKESSRPVQIVPDPGTTSTVPTTTTEEATTVSTTTEETTTTPPTTTTPKPTTQGAASSVAGWTLLLGVVTLSFLL